MTREHPRGERASHTLLCAGRREVVMVQPRFRVAGDAERGVVTTEFMRDAAMTAAIFGFFAAGWYGWAQDDPPTGWRRPLTVGSIAGILVAIAGGIVAWQNWSTGTVFDADTSRRYRSAVVRGWSAPALPTRAPGAHRAMGGIGGGVALLADGALLGYPLLYVVGVLLTVAALVSVPLARSRSITPSAVTGVMSGSILLVAALFSLLA